jgi:hypothetical protein
VCLFCLLACEKVESLLLCVSLTRAKITGLFFTSHHFMLDRISSSNEFVQQHTAFVSIFEPFFASWVHRFFDTLNPSIDPSDLAHTHMSYLLEACLNRGKRVRPFLVYMSSGVGANSASHTNVNSNTVPNSLTDSAGHSFLPQNTSSYLQAVLLV